MPCPPKVQFNPCSEEKCKDCARRGTPKKLSEPVVHSRPEGRLGRLGPADGYQGWRASFARDPRCATPLHRVKGAPLALRVPSGPP